MKRLLQVLLMATIALNWGAFKGRYERGHTTHGRRFEMASVQYFDNRTDAEEFLKDLKVQWPAAKIVPEMFSFKIAGDYACTKFLHVDGFVY